MKTKAIKLKLAVLLSATLFLTCEGVGVDIPHCTIPVNIELLESWDSVIGQSTGSIIVEATRGNGGYEYSLDDGPFQTTGDFTQLAGGDHIVTVRDRQGCSNTLTVTLREVALPSFANNIMPIFETNCSIRTCHEFAGRAPFEMTSHASVFPRVNAMRIRVINRTMPPRNRTPISEAQIATIVNWIDAGAPDN